MATQVQFRRGTTAQTSTFTGATAEITVDTDKKTIVVHDGTTVGGIALAREDSSNNVGSYANSAFAAANTSLFAGSYGNSAFGVANSAALYANAGFIVANSASLHANFGFTTANSAGVYANSAFIAANTSDSKAVISGSYANSAFVHANASFSFANTISGGAAIDNVARTLANSANALASSSFDTANLAFLAANASIATNATQNTNITNAGTYANSAFLVANTPTHVANSAASYANSAFTTANAGFTQANSNFTSAVTRLTVTHSGSAAYLFNQYSGNNPSIYVSGGETIAFHLNNVNGHPFMIRVSDGGANYDTGLNHVSNTGTILTGSSAQGKVSGTLYWKVPFDIVGSTYVYQCSSHGGMVGNIVIQQPVSFVAANTSLAFIAANTPSHVANSAASYANSGFAQANTDVTNINITSDTFGNSSHYPVITVSANGRINTITTQVVNDPSAIAFAIALG